MNFLPELLGQSLKTAEVATEGLGYFIKRNEKMNTNGEVDEGWHMGVLEYFTDELAIVFNMGIMTRYELWPGE